ncbi:MAG TPA: phosphatase PAP2 family protein [Propionibacteriaceae bacterium]|nr:phosphatase PAP2 family protein [Propionibacteriaceae bacterium]
MGDLRASHEGEPAASSDGRSLEVRAPARHALAVVDTGPRWWRPGLQLPGLVLWAAAMLLGFSVQNPRPPLAMDTSILVALIPTRTPFLVSACRVIEFWDGPQATPYLIVVAGVLVFLRGHRTLAVIAVVMTSLSWLPGHLAKSLFPRDRPGPETQPVWEVLGANSFPSGHTGLVIAATITAVFVMTALGHGRGRIVVAVVGGIWMVIVGLSRLEVAVHFPTDVLGGIGLDGGMALMLWPIAAGVNDVLPRRVRALADRRTP